MFWFASLGVYYLQDTAVGVRTYPATVVLTSEKEVAVAFCYHLLSCDLVFSVLCNSLVSETGFRVFLKRLLIVWRTLDYTVGNPPPVVLQRLLGKVLKLLLSLRMASVGLREV